MHTCGERGRLSCVALISNLYILYDTMYSLCCPCFDLNCLSLISDCEITPNSCIGRSGYMTTLSWINCLIKARWRNCTEQVHCLLSMRDPPTTETTHNTQKSEELSPKFHKSETSDYFAFRWIQMGMPKQSVDSRTVSLRTIEFVCICDRRRHCFCDLTQ